jgi:hydrogenase nickel incorporation protein HypA/HybF
MHEFAMCESMLKTLSAEYDRFVKERKPERAPRVTRVRLALGELHQIVPESFLVAWEALTAGTAFLKAKLELKKIPLRVRCRSCGWEGGIEAPFFLCGRCGKGEVDTISGNELYIEDMELEDDEPETI